MNIKRLCACLLALCLLACGAPALASGSPDADVDLDARMDDGLPAAPVGTQPGTHITVGSTTAMSGYFATDMWGSNTADIDVRTLLHGYSTVRWQGDSMQIDPSVVTDSSLTYQANGSGTHTFTIATDLTYSDGTPITAADYMFSLLLCGAPEITSLGGVPAKADFITGYADYWAGATPVITGARLLDEHTFSINIRAEDMVYFYSVARLDITPYPISVIAPGCAVRDDGQGVYIAAAPNAAPADGLPYTPGVFSTAMLRETMLNPRAGYVLNPRVTSGPYRLLGFDIARGTADFEINPRYKGDFSGATPHIQYITFRCIPSADMPAALAGGTVDLINKVSDPVAIAQLSAVPGVQRLNYWRTGFSFLSFACEQGPAASVAVRKAIASLVDVDALLQSVMGDQAALSASPVYGYYGQGQWMMGQTLADDQGGTPVQDAVQPLRIPFDPARAAALLDADGWVLDAQGQPYAQGTRYRRTQDGGLEALAIRWAKTADSAVADALQTLLTPAFAQAGIGLQVTTLPFTDMLSHYLRLQPRAYDMFYLGTNFFYIFDPSSDFSTDDAYQGAVNTTGLKDEQLMLLAKDMLRTPTADTSAYIRKWLAFQTRWADLLPMVPLYSNEYVDFYGPGIQSYQISAYATWSQAIATAYLADPAAPPAPESTVDEATAQPTPELTVDEATPQPTVTPAPAATADANAPTAQPVQPDDWIGVFNSAYNP
ncbi:MAG: ABC transporter substrate-binding protein [Oscillospiraceae bacterium]|jgi:ABC-type transport system substrate-binding protein|nr:ABC transporter substrate-binding protein [Oscillospiraceae bacterium]